VGGNHAWGPNGESCEPGVWETTNEDGPAPRIRPKVLYNPTTAPTGAAFCSSCGLRAEDNGTLLVGNSNNVVAVEARPGGPVYFSDFTSIYKLTLGG
jgi:hypothetical protein